jgi:hypothetical protein
MDPTELNPSTSPASPLVSPGIADETGGKPRGARARRVFVVISFVSLFFGFLWWLDFPKPFIDDLFFCGTALNMAGGGELTNPLLAWHPGEPFYFQPPVHSYVLAGWLRLFGISAGSLTGFQAVMYLCLTIAVIAILYRYGSLVWMECLVPLAVTAAFLGSGLRQEPLAAALTLGGFALVECGARRKSLVFLAFVLMFFGAATAPRMSLFSAGLAGLAAYRVWSGSAAGRERRTFLWLGLGALAVSVVIFLLMIHFQLAEFYRVFHGTAQLVVGNRRPLAAALLPHFGTTQKALLIMAALMAAFAWRYRTERPIQICIAIGLVFPIEFFCRFLGYGSGACFAILLILFLSVALFRRASRLGKGALLTALYALLIWLNLANIVEVSGILSGKIQSGHGEQYSEARGLTSAGEQRLLVDCSVARYTFSYQLPRRTLDFMYSSPFPHFGFATAYHPQDIYLLSPKWYDYVARSTYLESQPRPQWSISRWSFDQNPCRVIIVRAENCKAVRSASEKF